MSTPASKGIHNVWKSFSGWTKKNTPEEDNDQILGPFSRRQERASQEDATFNDGQEMDSLAPAIHHSEEGGPPAALAGTGRGRHGRLTNEGRLVTLAWADLWAETRAGKTETMCQKIWGKREEKSKTILREVSGVAQAGRLTAVMGASGAGKSTLMNILANHCPGNLEVRGHVMATESGKRLPSIDEISAYVPQEDEFVESMTVREHLVFQARLRTRRHTSMEEKMEQVESVLQELLTKPPLLFCDEPTSGLDSYMSEVLIRALKELAQRGHTILCTIHQPSSDVYWLFDRLILMADGRCVYQGDIDQAVGYFAQLGYQCPTDHCPADYFINVLSLTPGKEDYCRTRVDVLCTAYEYSTEANAVKSTIEELCTHTGNSLEDDTDRSAASRYEASPWQQWTLLLRRCSYDVARHPALLQSYLVTSAGLGTVLGLLYLRQPYNQSSIQNINGLLFLLLVQISTTTPARIAAVIPDELPIIIREHRRGMYSTEIYVIARFVIEVLTHVPQTWIVLGICYYMIGLNTNVFAFLVAMGTSGLMTVTSVSFGMFVSSVSSSSEVALNLLIPTFFLFSLLGGFYASPNTVPVYFIWVSVVSWYPAVYEILLVNQWSTISTLVCQANSSLPCLQHGEQVLERSGCDQADFVLDVVQVVLMATGYLLLAILGIRVRGTRHGQY